MKCLGFNVVEPAPSTGLDHEVNHQSYKQKGMPLLTVLLQEHTDLSEIYFLLFSLLFNANASKSKIVFFLIQNSRPEYDEIS